MKVFKTLHLALWTLERQTGRQAGIERKLIYCDVSCVVIGDGGIEEILHSLNQSSQN